MKISITGRPGRFVEEGNVIVTAMTQTKPPTIPKDLPNPGDGPTNYIIYISRKQWEPLKNAMSEVPDDILIVEGHPFFDKEMKVVSIFATRTTTRSLESVRRDEQRGDISEE